MAVSKEEAKKLISSPYAWSLLGLLTLIYISSFVNRQIIAVLATVIQEDMAMSNLQVGLLYGTSFSLIYAVSGIPMGRLADLYSRKAMIISGLLVWSLMTFLSGFATSLAFLIGARILVGVSEAALSPAVYSLLSDYFKPGKRATVFSIYASGIFVGIGVAFLAGGTVASLYDWRVALKVVGAPGLLLAVIAWFAIKELPRDAVDTSARYRLDLSMGEVVRYILKKRTMLYHLGGFSFLAVTGYTILGFLGTVLKEVYGAEQYLPYYGWFMFATALSVIAAGKAADRLASRWGPSRRYVVAIVAALACLPLYYLGLFSESGWWALLLIGSANVISSSYNGVAAALIQYLVTPNMRALAVGIYLFVISVIGFGVGPPLTGWLMDAVFTGAYGPSKSLMLVITCCSILGTGCFLMAMRSYDRDEETG